MADEPLRPDHSELLARRALTEDAARPDVVARRYAAGDRAELGDRGRDQPLPLLDISNVQVREGRTEPTGTTGDNDAFPLPQRRITIHASRQPQL